MDGYRTWEYQSWPLYDVCQGCGAHSGSMHAVECPRPGRKDVEVIPSSIHQEAVDLLREIGHMAGAKATGADARAMAKRAREFMASTDSATSPRKELS